MMQQIIHALYIKITHLEILTCMYNSPQFMKVFFVGSPRALKEYKKELHKIYHTIDSMGHENLYHLIVETEHDSFYKKDKKEIDQHFIKITKALHKADIIIIEASIHSLAIGYLTRVGEELDKPVVVLHLPNCEPFFFSGNTDERFFVAEYTYATIPRVLKEVFQYATEALDIRFNLFLSPQMNAYLKLVSKKQGLSRSVFMRQLLQEHMKQHPDL